MAARKPYAVETSVPVLRSREEIEVMLTKFGATSFAYANQVGKSTIMFEYGGRRIRFDLPLPKESTSSKTEKSSRHRWRALLLSIKAKLVSVDTGIESFEQAFLAHIVLADGSTVHEASRPAIEQQYKTGRMTPLLGPPPKGD